MRPLAGDVDRHVGLRVRRRRAEIGLSQPRMAELVGVTHQQLGRYERGTNRIAAGRLHAVARALGVEVGYFFEGAAGGGPPEATPERRRMLQLTHDFACIPSRRQQEALCALARVLGGPEEGGETAGAQAP